MSWLQSAFGSGVLVDYIELQYHGTLSLENVSGIYSRAAHDEYDVVESLSAGLVTKLKAMGIEVKQEVSNDDGSFSLIDYAGV